MIWVDVIYTDEKGIKISKDGSWKYLDTTMKRKKDLNKIL